MILPQMFLRAMHHVGPTRLARFALPFALGNAWALARHALARRRGLALPPFLFLSLTNRCNLRCQGCWVATDAPPADLDLESACRLIRSARRRGARFFGLLGGEPLLYPHLWELLARFRDCTFQLLTNGTLLDDDAATRLARLGHVTPLISIEGSEIVSDTRRGGQNVLARSLAGLDACIGHGLVTGTASSLCATNLHDLLSDAFLDGLIDRGVMYHWYYLYRPSGRNPHPELALGPEQIRRVREFLVSARARKPLLLVDAYWDGHGKPLCPAEAGISHHVNCWGDVEPCPPIQFARDSILAAADPAGRIAESTFLDAFRSFAGQSTRGCVLLDNPHGLAEFMHARDARDSSGRHVGPAELEALPACCSHGSCPAIPDVHWAYRLAKKFWLLGMGAYG